MLANYTVLSLYRYGTLAELVLRDMPASMPAATYQRSSPRARRWRRCTSCHVSGTCGCTGKTKRLVIGVLGLWLKELVVDGCSFLATAERREKGGEEGEEWWGLQG